MAQQSWSRAGQSPEPPPGVDYAAGGAALLERAAVSAFQRSPQWTTDILGAFKPVSGPVRCTRGRAMPRTCSPAGMLLCVYQAEGDFHSRMCSQRPTITNLCDLSSLLQEPGPVEVLRKSPQLGAPRRLYQLSPNSSVALQGGARPRAGSPARAEPGAAARRAHAAAAAAAAVALDTVQSAR